MVVRIGTAITTLVEKMGSPSIVNSNAGPIVEEEFSVDYVSAEGAITARGLVYGSACPIAGGAYSDALLKTVTIRKDGPTIATVIYRYQTNDKTSTGSITQGADSNTIEIPIGQHPDASGTNYDYKNKIGIGDWEGVEAFLSPQPVYNRTEVLDAFVFSEANIIKNVSKRFTTALMTAEGLTGASESKWLLMSRNIETVGEKFEERESWQYAEDGWDPTIYDEATS